ncbi:MAG: Gfo/Idh/MocA family oxidoreductase [Salinivirgaceae bacterium]|nr:Gfo/Idh/MocA family oxidoreductase [Salinivirgaceae bacterium]
MQKKINIGILGCAKIAERFMIPALLDLPNHFNIIGIASRDFTKASICAKRFNIKPYNGYQDLLNDTLLDAIYIPLPNSLHAEWIEKALLNGLNVLVEKSLACNYEDVERLTSIAKARNLVLVENFQFRFHSQLKFIKEKLESGVIGELRCMRSSFGFPPFPEADNIRYNKELGGGALLDAGAYPIKISQIFLGDDIEVKAANLSFDEEKGVDIWGGAYLKQKNGNLFSEIAFGFDNFYQCNIELWGSAGKIYANRIFTAPPGFCPIVEIETSKGINKIELPEDHHFKNMLLHFFNLIIFKETVDIELSQNLNQARLINEIIYRNNE